MKKSWQKKEKEWHEKRKKVEEQGVRTAAEQGLITLNRETNMKSFQRKETIASVWSWKESRVGKRSR